MVSSGLHLRSTILIGNNRLLSDFGDSIIKKLGFAATQNNRATADRSSADVLYPQQRQFRDETESIFSSSSDVKSSIFFGQNSSNSSIKNDDDYIYFGPSSTVIFSRRILSLIALASCRAATEDRKFSPVQRVTQSSRQPLPKFNTFIDKDDIYSIPDDSICYQLINKFFENTGIVFPIFHRQIFIADFKSTRDSGLAATHSGWSWLARLNIVLALGTLDEGHVNTNLEQGQQAELFYSKAIQLYHYYNGANIMAPVTLDVVQFLLLVCLYLQRTRRPHECWNTIGLAIRSAIQLGLHSKHALNRLTRLDRETRKRTWHACVLIDQTISVTLGKPQSLSSGMRGQVELPLHIDEDIRDIHAAHETKLHLPSSLLPSYVQSIRLYNVLSDIVDDIYDGNLDWNEVSYLIKNADELEVVFDRIERSLTTWASELPDFLQIIPANFLGQLLDEIINDTSDSLVKRQHVILILRYHFVRLLFHRAIISNLLMLLADRNSGARARPHSEFEGKNIQGALIACIEIITIVRRASNKICLLGPWWSILNYVFQSSLVLVAVIMLRHEYELGIPLVLIENYQLVNHLDQAISFIDDMARTNSVAAKCLEFLRYLRYAISSTAGNQSLNYQMAKDNLASSERLDDEPESDVGISEFLLESDLRYLQQKFNHISFV
ncbi:Asg1p [Sugiyamaella lignohabitans]|uniref:Asg1p n=1 Tax=Sugiyamaella lignohabitans TaxID=796027 RepID=A0A167D6Y0_9ASCO|nr:Asg1p [Sugiyamaella lignohabitans]ANB12556.1 Asg1p [Sugiyamaella lignohabitans]